MGTNPISAKSKPFLRTHLVTYLSFSDQKMAYITDIVSGKALIEIDAFGHDALELADGQKTIDEISELLFQEHISNHCNILSARADLLGFFQNLYHEGLIEVANYGDS